MFSSYYFSHYLFIYTLVYLFFSVDALIFLISFNLVAYVYNALLNKYKLLVLIKLDNKIRVWIHKNLFLGFFEAPLYFDYVSLQNFLDLIKLGVWYPVFKKSSYLGLVFVNKLNRNN